MTERLFQTLAQWLIEVPVVLASVIATRGATPRKGGSRMLIGPGRTAFSIGGGLAEATVIEAAHSLIERAGTQSEISIDLSGKPGAAGVCGGAMHIALRRWSGTSDRQRAVEIAQTLTLGRSTMLRAQESGGAEDERLLPQPRLLIVGAGHCAAALCELAAYLDYDLCISDERRALLESPAFANVQRIEGSGDALRAAFDTERAMHVVLLNRDYAGDVTTLRAIKGLTTQFLGMMGSRRRIATVLAALPDQPDLTERLHAPIGIAIGAHTPHEIAVSILAELILANAVR